MYLWLKTLEREYWIKDPQIAISAKHIFSFSDGESELKLKYLSNYLKFAGKK